MPGAGVGIGQYTNVYVSAARAACGLSHYFGYETSQLHKSAP